VTITLTTTGRRSGRPREVTLYAYKDADRLVVVASFGGASKDPDWAVNLRSEPSASVREGRVMHQVRALEVEGSERDRLWQLVCGEFPLYQTYQQRTKRIIPIFVLEPIDE
jgi:deazaflavin-dependent oxidoreductase (nitroreductase family)